jgi:hypothetical protein
MYKAEKQLSVKEVMKKYPRITAHVIAESLGYATPSCAAGILRDAIEGRENYCEWIYSCYGKDPKKAVRDAIKRRHYHKGFMAEYKTALALVKRAIETGEEPLFASWF